MCVCVSGSKEIQWDFVHGLMESAIYGGRVDNSFDTRVMVSYLKQFFDAGVIGEQGRGSRKLGPLKMPTSTQHRVSVEVGQGGRCGVGWGGRVGWGGWRGWGGADGEGGVGWVEQMGWGRLRRGGTGRG